MQDHEKSQNQLIDELNEMRSRVSELETCQDRLLDMERTLRESQERFQVLYEDTPMCCQSLDNNACVLEVNRAWLNTFGYIQKEVIGKWFGDFLAPGYQERFKVNFSNFVEKGQGQWAEFEMLRNDGSRISVVLDGQILCDESGCFKQTYCILHDVTELKESQKALEKSERKHREFLKSLPLGIYAIDMSGRFTYMNPHGLQMFGYTEHDLEEGIFTWDLLPQDQSQKSLDNIKSIAQGGKLAVTKYRAVRKDGTVFPIIAYSGALLDDDKVVGVLGVLVDISD
jgi:PAS domain S-box-containing protein